LNKPKALPGKWAWAFLFMNYDSINDIITNKTANLKARLKQSIAANNIRHTDTLWDAEPLSNISTRLSRQFGMVNRIRIKFKRSGVFVSKGVGRGTKAGQVGTTNRQAKDWFNPVVEEFTDELANEVADELADITFNSIKIK